MSLLIERHKNLIAGVLSCFDRGIITGTLADIAHAEAMVRHLNAHHTRSQGTRIRHHMGPASIKLYDKAGIMARVACTANNVSFFKHHREVAQPDGGRVWKLAPLRKTIYSLRVLRKPMHAANERDLAFNTTLDNPAARLKAIDKIVKPARPKDRSYRGFNLFLTIARGEWAISSFRAIRGIVDP
jgi:hypothetical protein